MTTVLAACLTVFGAGAASVLVALVAQRVLPPAVRHDLGASGGMVALVAVGAFVLSVGAMMTYTWLDLGRAGRSTFAEAGALDDLYWYSHVVGGADGVRLRTEIRDYTTEVVRAEWPAMNAGGGLGDRGWRLVNLIRYDMELLQPKPGGEAERYQEALESAERLVRARRDRATVAADRVPGLMWAAVVACGLLVAALPIVRGNPRTAVRAVLAFVVASTIAFVLFLLYHLDEPFGGSVQVPPTAFQATWDGYGDIDALWARKRP
ncbi:MULTISPECIES: DUF4239 domain-containing protein [Actinomadura]|uniref:DUF4239 domain-containing protein n=1 Tax=Actinomadura yumaensis TaxID=111807 RepID=A0ABW2CWW6_9ACTN|nr:DUF4239 domain-containing protein [Actinomadura sp. J1-007]